MKHQTKDWEKDVVNWMRRHEIPEEKITLFMPFLWRKMQIENLKAMRAVVHARS